MTHLAQLLLASSIQRVLADLHQLLEEDVSDLGEASAGGLHQGLQDGADVGLHAAAEELLGFGQHHSCSLVRGRTADVGGGGGHVREGMTEDTHGNPAGRRL